MNTVNVGNFICKLRNEKGLTQKELANEIGVTDKAVSKWETGKCYPDIETIEKLSKLFNISINELLSGERILPEKIKEEADKNIVQVLKNTKKQNRTLKIVHLTINIISLILFFLASYNMPAYKHISYQTYSQNSSSVFNEISAAIHKEFQISPNTVCSASYIRYDRKGEVNYIDMWLWDSVNMKDLSVKYWLDDESGLPQTKITEYPKEIDLDIDGIGFDKYISFLSAENIGKIIELSGSNYSFGYAVSYDADYEISNENSYLYKNGKINPLKNANQIKGNVFGISVIPYAESDMENSSVESYKENPSETSCAAIYFPQ